MEGLLEGVLNLIDERRKEMIKVTDKVISKDEFGCTIIQPTVSPIKPAIVIEPKQGDE